MSNYGYVSVPSLLKKINLFNSVPNNESPDYELVGQGDGSKSTFWLSKKGVIENSYAFYYGSSYTVLIETTDYSFDIEKSKLTLTSSGISKVGTDNIYSSYDYNSVELPNSVIVNSINYAEDIINKEANTVFSEFTSSSPKHLEITRVIPLKHSSNRYIYLNRPIVLIETTTASDYVTGQTTIELTDATGLKESGVLYIGGVKVSYTARSGNTITVSSSTSSISSGSKVSNFVVEVDSTNTKTNYSLLTPNTDYFVDQDKSIVKINNSLSSTVYAEDQFTNFSTYRLYFNSSWHESGQNPTIPEEIKTLTIKIALSDLMKSVVERATLKGIDTFKPTLINVSAKEIETVLGKYRTLGVSFGNKHRDGFV